MATIKEITTMCKAGQIQEAYELAKTDLEQFPTALWVHREMAWALNYQMKNDADIGNYQSMITHIDELKALNLLSIPADNILFDNVLFKIAGLIYHHVVPTDVNTPAKLSTIFSKLKDYTFSPSKAYSFLLQSVIKCGSWTETADFIDWWNLSNLTQEDYKPYKAANGKQIMSVAERAFIAYSKALLLLKDLGRIEKFLPKLDNLMNTHPEMTYPGYFYGKLLLSLGSTPEEALKVIIPFARKKATEFWVWQLLSEVFTNEPDKQLACLLRAVHCHTQESFLGKVRIKLASLYIQRNMLDYAKFQIDKVTQCYLSQGWHVPYEIDCWIHQPWINLVTPNSSDPIDYLSITNDILCEGTKEAIAIVTFADQKTQKAYMIYGQEKRMSQKLRLKVGEGTVLKINYIIDSNGHPKILNANKAKVPTDLSYAKFIDGKIKKREEWDFAFVHYDNKKCFVPSKVVRKYRVVDGQDVNCLIVCDYNKGKKTWNWVCLSMKSK